MPNIQEREREKNLAGLTGGSLLFQLQEERISDRIDAIGFSILIAPDHWRLTLNDTIFVLDAFTKMITYSSGGGKSLKMLVKGCKRVLRYLEKIRAFPYLLDVYFLRWQISTVNVCFMEALGKHSATEQKVFLDCMVEALGHITPVHQRILGDQVSESEGGESAESPSYTKDEVI